MKILIIGILINLGFASMIGSASARAADHGYQYRPPPVQRWQAPPVVIYAPPPQPTVPLHFLPLAFAVSIPVSIGEVLLTPVPVPAVWGPPPANYYAPPPPMGYYAPQPSPGSRNEP